MKIKILVIVLVVIALLGGISFLFVSVKKDKAKEIILEDVNAVETDIEVISKGTSIDDFKLIYEMEFYYQNVKYEYSVNLFNNEIVSHEQEGQKTTQSVEPKPDDTTNKVITSEEAKTIALEDAGVPVESVNNIIVNEDSEDGILEYDIEFSYDNVKYEYTISTNGTIVSYDKENIIQ